MNTLKWKHLEWIGFLKVVEKGECANKVKLFEMYSFERDEFV